MYKNPKSNQQYSLGPEISLPVPIKLEAWDNIALPVSIKHEAWHKKERIALTVPYEAWEEDLRRQGELCINKKVTSKVTRHDKTEYYVLQAEITEAATESSKEWLHQFDKMLDKELRTLPPPQQ